MHDVRWVVNALGGATVVADALGMPAGDAGARTVRAWVFRNSIPGEWFTDLAALAKLKGRPEITEQSLAELAKGRRLARHNESQPAA